jgi:hypothetical protein
MTSSTTLNRSDKLRYLCLVIEDPLPHSFLPLRLAVHIFSPTGNPEAGAQVHIQLYFPCQWPEYSLTVCSLLIYPYGLGRD